LVSFVFQLNTQHTLALCVECLFSLFIFIFLVYFQVTRFLCHVHHGPSAGGG
jgi:hypothetical protein